MMWKIIAVATGGAAGSVLRYGLSALALRWLGPGFPWGTLAVNLAGCFAVGLLAEVFAGLVVTDTTRVFVLVGVLGGFTTFSTFGLETARLIGDGQWTYAALNAVVSTVLGVVLVVLGFAAGRGLLEIMR